MNNKILEDDLVMMITDFYKTMSDPTRLKIIYTLIQGEMCVQDISKKVKMSQTAVSYQLRVLKGARLVKYRRDGKMIYYSIEDDHVNKIINTTIEHLEHEE